MASDIYAKIRQAAFELVGEGVWPTVVEVRQRLGTGSNTTINTTLKAWRGEFLGRVAVSARRPDWPEGLAELFEQLWQRACDTADAQLETVRGEVRDEALALRGQVSTLEELVLARNLDLERAARGLERESARVRELERELGREREQSKTLASRSNEQARALELARSDAQTMRGEIETRVAAAEARCEARVTSEREEASRREALAYERLEGLRVYVYEQVEDERRSMESERKRLEEELTTVRAELARQDIDWRERNGEREREFGRQSARLDGLIARTAELQAELVAERAELTATRERLLAVSSELARRAAEDRGRIDGWLRVLREERKQWTALSDTALEDWMRGHWVG